MANSLNRWKILAVAGLAVGCVAALGMAGPATSAPSFDGVWSVVIVTEKGTCDRAYRYPIRISKGAVVNEGSSPATIGCSHQRCMPPSRTRPARKKPTSRASLRISGL